MGIDSTADTAVRLWRGHKLLAAGLAVAAVALAAGVGYLLGESPYKTAPDLVARLAELGAPCAQFDSLDDDKNLMGICKYDGGSLVIVTDSEQVDKDVPALVDKIRWNEPGTADKSVATGNGWYVYGTRRYATQVADLLDGDLLP